MAGSAHAADLGGDWKHVREKQSFKVAKWGEACGPKPENFNQKTRGKVTVTVKGDRVGFKKRRWKFGTHACLSRNPEMRFRGYDAASKTTRCSTDPGNSKLEEGKYTLKLKDDNTIKYEGLTTYDWSLKGVSCKARMTEVHIFERAEPIKPPPPPVVEAPPPVEEPAPAPAPAPDEPAEEVVSEPTDKVAKQRKKKTGGGFILDLEGEEARGGAGGLGGLANERHQVGTAVARRGAGLALAIILGAIAISLFAGAFLLVSRRRAGRRPGGKPPAGGAGGVPGAQSGDDGDLQAAPRVDHRRNPPGGPGGDRGSGLMTIERGGPKAPSPPPPSQLGLGRRMLCPKCHRDFGPDEGFCRFDGAALRRTAADGGEEFVPSTRLICRSCLHELPLTESPPRRCPKDGGELLPLIGTRASTEDGVTPEEANAEIAKICPKCGGRARTRGARYCSRDGSELVAIQ